MGLEWAGLCPSWQVEIDPTARNVLARHWPDVERHEDVRTVGKQNLAPVDVLVGGFPCQGLSIAGKGKGLADARSGLFYELARITAELRPGLLVWENVPGLLSNDNGRDFARVLRHLGDLGYFGAWRVLDSQFFGVAQRRRRVFGVFARGCAGIGRCAEILALAEGVQGHPPTSRQAGQDIAFTLTATSGRNSAGNRIGNPWNTTFVATNYGAGTYAESEVTSPITQGTDRSRGTALIAYGGNRTSGERRVCSALSAKGGTGRIDFETETFVMDRVAHTLRGEGFDASEDGTGRGTPLVGNTDRGVRRMIPRECERVQGWPDDWTRWRADGTEIADGPRYRMIGNGVTSTVAEWLGLRIKMHGANA